VTYQILPARGTPTPRSLPHLYDSLDKQFAYGLDRILDGLGISHDFPLPLTSDQPGRQPKADHRGRQRCRYESELEQHCGPRRRRRQGDFGLCGGISGSTH
jgi:hypothetical protein